MEPYRPLVIDNRMPRAQFLDGNPITDGLANLFASAINAPIAAGQIRRQRELDDQALARQDMLDRRAEDWRGQDLDRQAKRDAMAQVWQDAQIGNMQADNARQLAGMFGSWINNAAARGIDAIRALRGLFAGGPRGQSTPAASLWYTFKGDDGSMYKINRQTGDIVPAVPATPMPSPANPVLPEAQPDMPEAGAFPEGPGNSFWTMHRSGKAGVGTAGDLLGGLWDGWTGYGVRQDRAGDPSVGPPAPPPAPASENRPPAAPADRVTLPSGWWFDAKTMDMLKSDTPERAAYLRSLSTKYSPQDLARLKADLKAMGIR